MEWLFLEILNMSITSVFLIAAVFAARFLLKKAPKWITCLLWALVGIKLVCPFSLESVFSLIPSSRPIPQDITLQTHPRIDSGIPMVDRVVNPVITEYFTPEITNTVNPLQIVQMVAAVIWVVGMMCLLLYAVISYFRLYKKVSPSIRLSDKNIYVCDDIETPFILGVFRPRIYIPSGLSDRETEHVTAHEQAHIRRKDHFWKPLGFAILSLHWFNPFVWAAYFFLCKDIELACDEKVIKDLEKEESIAYSQTLLSCSVSRRSIFMCPLAFGEVSVKDRIKYVLNYKKPALWIVIIGILVCLVVGICFLTGKKEDAAKKPKTEEGLFEETLPEKMLPEGVYEEDGVLIDNPHLEDARLKEIMNHLENLPEDAAALADEGCFVISHVVVFGSDYLERFEKLLGQKHPADLVVGSYTIEGDLILYYLDYDGDQITLVLDTRRDKWGNSQIVVTRHQFFARLDQELEDGERYETLLLHNDPEMTAAKWEQILSAEQADPKEWEGLRPIAGFRIQREETIQDRWSTLRDYPIKDLAELNSYSFEERLEILNPPADLLEQMSTEELVHLTLTYPMYGMVPWYPDEEKKIQLGVFMGWSDIFRELTGRKDMISCLLAEYEKKEPIRESPVSAEAFMEDFVLAYGEAFSKEEKAQYQRIAAQKSEEYALDEIFFGEDGKPYRKEKETSSEAEVHLTFVRFMKGDIPLEADPHGRSWVIPNFNTKYPSYEYLFWNLDGVGEEELIVQIVDNPEGYNGVFHLEDGKVYCWNSDAVDGSDRDYPLKDGTMVHQYDFSENTSYTIYRYLQNGEKEELHHLFARRILMDAESKEPCPYYEIDGEEVTKEEFDSRVKEIITDRRPVRTAWNKK